jgi:hypothetical protein
MAIDLRPTLRSNSDTAIFGHRGDVPLPWQDLGSALANLCATSATSPNVEGCLTILCNLDAVGPIP